MSTITSLVGSTPVTTAGAAAIINTNFSNLNTDKIETSYIDTDTTLAANSDSKIATQKAVKAYVDAGGNVNASETTKGIVEEATDAEVTAGTATGATGAKLFVTPAKLATRTTAVVAALSVVKKITISTTEVTFTNGDGGAGAGVEQTLFSTTVPGATIGTNNAIRFKIFIRSLYANGVNNPYIFKLKYGGSTLVTTATVAAPSNVMSDCNGILEGYIVGDGSTSVQKAMLGGMFASYSGETRSDAVVGVDKLHLGGYGTGAVDSTADQTLTVTLTQTNNANNDCVVEWFILEAIK